MVDSQVNTNSELNQIFNLRNAFVITAIIGSLWIILSLIIGFHQIIAIVVSILIMFGYLFYFYRWCSKALRDMFADSIYYLGFLLTIIALVSTMIQFGTNSELLNANIILSQFGMAMVTTLVGMCVRVYYKQFDLSVDLAQASAHQTLYESVTNFAIQMRTINSSLNDLSSVITNSISDIEKSNIVIINSLEETKKISNNLIRDFSLEIKDSINQSINIINENSKVSIKEIRDFNEEYKKTLKDMISENNDFMQSNMQSFEFKINDVFSSIAIKATKIDTVIDDFNTKCHKLNDDTSFLSDNIKEQANKLSYSFGCMDRNIEKITISHDSLIINMDAMINDYQQKLQDLGNGQDVLVKRMEKTIHDYDKLFESLKVVSDFSGLKRLSDEDENWLKTLELRREKLDKLNNTLSIHSDDLIQCVSSFSENLVDVSKFITNKLGDKNE